MPDGNDRPAEEGRWFVGRGDVLDAVLGFLAEPGRGHRLSATGTWGMGKSALVDELEQRSKEKAVVVKIRSGRHVPRSAATGAGEVPPMTLLQNWDCYAALLADLCDELGTEGFAQVGAQTARARERCAAVRVPVPEKIEFKPKIEAESIEVKGKSSLASLFFSAEEPLHLLEAAIGEARDALGNAFATELDRVAAASGAVLLVDEFDKLKGHLVGHWILELVADVEKAVVVLTTRAAGSELAAYELDQRDLPPFTADEVREYLGLRLGTAASDELVERALRFSGGLPAAVAMAADLVAQRGRTGGEAALADVELDDATPATTTLLARIVSELPEEDAVKLLREGRLARRIDLDLSHWLLFAAPYAERTPEAARSGAAWEALKAYSFVEEYDPAGADGIGRFRFHEYITRAEPPPGDETLPVDEEAVHESIAAFYERRRDDYDAACAGKPAYQQWYRYEDRAWQTLTREWLYHCGKLRRPAARKAARLELARIFLDAFWWWGCYVPFEFCEQLVDDWETTQPAGEEAWAGALRELLRSYPPGPQKLGRGDWMKVAEALRTLREGADVEAPVPLEDPPDLDERAARLAANAREVRAFTSLFRAQSFRFQEGVADLAVADYEDALAYLAGDVVATAWTTFELAELKLELGDPEGALAGLRAAAPVAKAEGDYELLANLHRLRGDIALSRGEEVKVVAEASAKALLRAYAFLIRPKPDPYTVAFYEEQRARLAARLLELKAADAKAAAALVVEQLEPLRATRPAAEPAAIGKALKAKQEAELADLLAPPAPPLGDEALRDVRFAASSQRAKQAVDRDPADLELAESA